MCLKKEKTGDPKHIEDLVISYTWGKTEGRVQVSCLGNRTDGEDGKRRFVQNRNSFLDI